MKKLGIIGVILYFLFGNIISAQAVSVVISNIPSSADSQPFTFDVLVSGAQPGTNYLRANLFPTGTTNYFGYTFNGSSYYNGPDFSQYFPITVDTSGNWSGSIQTQLDPSSSYYSGPGSYSLKVRRYTQSGSSYIWSNEGVITLTSDPTPTPTPTPTQSQTPQSSFSINNLSSQIDTTSSQTISVNLSLPNNPNSQFYLKGAFFKDGSSNYFGKTQVNDNWIKNNQTYTSQSPITTDSSGNYSGNIIVMPDQDDSGFIGSGSYSFKVGRYDSSGNLSWSNALTTQINQSSSTQNSDILASSTSAPSPLSSSAVIEASDNPTYSGYDYLKSDNLATVAGEATQSSNSTLKKENIKISSNTRNNPLLILSILCLLIGSSALVYFFKKR